MWSIVGCQLKPIPVIQDNTYFVVAAIFVIVSAILGRAFLAVDLPRFEAQVPNLRVVFHLQSLISR